MCVSAMTKQEFIDKQTEEATDLKPFIRCGCFKKVWLHEAYKCLYCGEWYCKVCAEKHFGQTVEQYRAANT